MDIKQKLSYSTKLEMVELPRLVFNMIDSLFDTYNVGFMGLDEVHHHLQTIYNQSSSSDKNVIIKIIDDIKRLKPNKSNYKLDYTISTSINVSMVDFKNAGLTDEEILKVVRAQEYVNCAIMTRSFCGCEITFYSSCFNRNIIEKTVKEIQDKLNHLVKNK